MLETVSAIIILVFVISLCLTKDILHPSVIVSGVWMVLLNLYIYCNHPLWNLSEYFCKAILFWVLPFSFTSCLFSIKALKLSRSSIDTPVNVRMYNKLYPYVFLYVCLFVFLLVYYAGGFSFTNIRLFMVGNLFPTILSVLFYLNTFMTVYAFYGLLNIDTLDKKKVLGVIALLLLISVFKSNKTSFLVIFIGILYILKRKKRLKLTSLIYAITILIILLSLVTYNRGDYDFDSDAGLENFMYIYLLSPLTAFDLLLNNEISLNAGAIGSGTFAFLFKIINAFGTNLEIADLGEWVYVPLPTNVFTVMRGFYLDGGYWGIFFMACVLGSIWGILYQLQHKGHKVYIVFYATMISSLFFQSFGDYFFYAFSMTIQYYLFSVILTRGIKCHK